ncbi:MAG: ABC transporter permease [Chloroflexales bacterium]|nr:ABC transporter permease [Chloroflexales bacterium]
MRQHSRTFLTAAWLGWQIESNWTAPLVFFAFSILKPVSSVLILVFMYNVVAQTGPGDPIFAYIYLGNSFYIYVGAVMAGASYSILDDRERYRTLKYIYIAPVSVPVYLVGRAAARFVIGTVAVIVTLGAGSIFFGLPVNALRASWPLFAASMALGLAAMVFMGIMLGSWTLTIRNEPWFIGEAVAAALYLFSGAIFPIDILPRWLQPLGLALPISYWLELVRRSLLGADAAAFPTFSALSDVQLLLILAGMTAALALLAALTFRHFDRIARDRGLIDVVSNF